MSAVNQAPSGISSGPAGGGISPGTVTLQLAYDNGPTITEAANTPVVISETDGTALALEHTVVAPVSTNGVLDVLITGDTSGSVVPIRVKFAPAPLNAQVQVLNVSDADDVPVLILRADQLRFAVPKALQDYATIGLEDSSNLVIQVSPTVGQPGSAVGEIRIGPSFGPNDIDGGLTMEASGRLRLNKHAQGIDVMTDPRGCLRLHNVLDSEAQIPPEEGDLFLQTNDSGGTTRDKGLRSYRAGAQALVMRGQQRTFTDADLTAGVLSFAHGLDTLGVGLFVYDDAGALVQPTLSLGPSYTVATVDANNVDVSINPALLPISGIWRITGLGF